MVTASFFISLGVVLALMALMAGGRNALAERRRQKLELEVGAFLDGAVGQDAERATGRFRGLDVEIVADHDRVEARVTLPYAVLTYQELLDRFGGDAMWLRIERTGGRLTDDGKLVVGLGRETNVADTLATLEQRLAIVDELTALRRFAPVELASRIPRVHSSCEVDEILDQLTRYFPEAPETCQAFDAALARSKDKRLAARAKSWAARQASV